MIKTLLAPSATTALIASLALFSQSCEQSSKLLKKTKTTGNSAQVNNPPPGSDNPEVIPPPQNGTPTQETPENFCSLTENEKGFGGRILDTIRKGSDQVYNQMRIKPIRAVVADYTSILGSSPVTVAEIQPTFLVTPNRWYIEPASNAVSIVSMLSLNLRASKTYLETNGTPVASLESASLDEVKAACTAFQKMVWLTDPSTEQVDVCADYAKNKAAGSDDLTRWSFTYASVLTASGFVAY